jgi:hypothetical protein
VVRGTWCVVRCSARQFVFTDQLINRSTDQLIEQLTDHSPHANLPTTFLYADPTAFGDPSSLRAV